jgi:hypothetical protein
MLPSVPFEGREMHDSTEEEDCQVRDQNAHRVELLASGSWMLLDTARV